MILTCRAVSHIKTFLEPFPETNDWIDVLIF